MAFALVFAGVFVATLSAVLAAFAGAGVFGMLLAYAAGGFALLVAVLLIAAVTDEEQTAISDGPLILPVK
ncbi:MAG: hypothetical protein GKR98_03300 [Boseongicola sp.]|nr:MAG: hypothetical protein GKR98_03300 [Boseongicola sp.]